MTIKEIASTLGVSPATVSLCLNGRESDPRYCIRPEKAQRIRAFARENGYIPDAAAIRLRSSTKLPPVGIIFNEIHGFERRLRPLHDAIEVLEKHGRDYQVISYQDSHMSRALTALRSQRVAEVIALGYIQEPSLEGPKPYQEDMSIQDKKRWEAFQDDWRKTHELLRHMTLYAPYYRFPRPLNGGVQQGIVRMGNDIQKFEENILRKIIEAGKGPVVISQWCGNERQFAPDLIPNEDYIITPGKQQNKFEAGKQLGRTLAAFRRKNFFKTVFYGNDIIACGIMTGLIEAGLRVPEDVGVLGFGNDDLCPGMRVPLSSFDSGIEQNVQKAVNAIVNHIQLPQEIHTEFNYYQRESFQF